MSVTMTVTVDKWLTCVDRDTVSVGEHINQKASFSFGHYSELPRVGQLCPLFWTSKFKVWKTPFNNQKCTFWIRANNIGHGPTPTSPPIPPIPSMPERKWDFSNDVFPREARSYQFCIVFNVFKKLLTPRDPPPHKIWAGWIRQVLCILWMGGLS